MRLGKGNQIWEGKFFTYSQGSFHLDKDPLLKLFLKPCLGLDLCMFHFFLFSWRGLEEKEGKEENIRVEGKKRREAWS